METITQRVRTFLTRQGATIEPWSGLDATYCELYALLERRRDDPALWRPLEELLGEILQRAADPAAERRLSAPAAELISSWDAAELVASLRQSLADSARSDVMLASGPGAYRRLTRQLSPSVLGAFLVLGLAAAGCTGNDARPEGTGGDGAGGTGSAAVESGGTSGVTAGGVTTGGVSTGGLLGSGGNTGGGGAAAGGMGGVGTGGGGTGGGTGAAAGQSGGVQGDAGEPSAGAAGQGQGGWTRGGAAGADLAQGGLAQGGLAQGGLAQGGGGGAASVCMIEDAEVLASTIDDSTLSAASKATLCACMTQLSESWRDGLTSLFETGTADEIAVALEEMLLCCSLEVAGRASFSQDSLLRGTLCEPFLGVGGAYKGVTFPD